MSTGHEGSMSTVHANSCRDALGRLEQMVGMAGLEMSPRIVRAQIASAIDIVVQLERMSDGKRRLVSLHEVTGMEGDVVQMNEIFQFRRVSTDIAGAVHGQFLATGVRPKFQAELATRGINLSHALFIPDRVLE
jgi:pilus assembly protein CpaF